MEKKIDSLDSIFTLHKINYPNDFILSTKFVCTNGGNKTLQTIRQQQKKSLFGYWASWLLFCLFVFPFHCARKKVKRCLKF